MEISRAPETAGRLTVHAAEAAQTSLSSTAGTTVIPSRLQRANHHRQTVPNGLLILLLVLIASCNFIQLSARYL